MAGFTLGIAPGSCMALNDHCAGSVPNALSPNHESDHMDVWHSDWLAPEADSNDGANPEDNLMHDVLAEQRSNGEDNELNHQLVQQLNLLRTRSICVILENFYSLRWTRRTCQK